MAQEHWLSEKKIPSLQQLDAQFVARSGMEDALTSRIYPGRPFGGVCICWSQDLNHLIVPLTKHKHKRVVAIEMNAGNQKILLICAYMPFFNQSKRQECMAEYIDAVSFIELLIEEHPQHLVVIGGDLNTELRDNSPFDPLWKNMMSKNGFASCDRFATSPQYTYRHDSLNQTKFNDHFIISKVFLEQNIAHSHSILDEGDNNSDHLPLPMKMSLQLQPGSNELNEPLTDKDWQDC